MSERESVYRIRALCSPPVQRPFSISIPAKRTGSLPARWWRDKWQFIPIVSYEIWDLRRHPKSNSMSNKAKATKHDRDVRHPIKYSMETKNKHKWKPNSGHWTENEIGRLGSLHSPTVIKFVPYLILLTMRKRWRQLSAAFKVKPSGK